MAQSFPLIMLLSLNRLIANVAERPQAPMTANHIRIVYLLVDGLTRRTLGTKL